MSPADFVRLPLGVIVLVVVMFSPVIWAGTLMIVALAGDVRRQSTSRMPPAWRNVA
jgi:hypothetical protein